MYFEYTNQSYKISPTKTLQKKKDLPYPQIYSQEN